MNYQIKTTLKLACILDDYTLFSEILAKTLEDYNFFNIAKVFTNEKNLINYLTRLNNSEEVYLFLDYNLEGGLRLLGILQNLKRIAKKCKIIIISGITNPVHIRNILEFEPNGIIHKSDGLNGILTCIKIVKSGESYTSESIKNILNQQLPFENSSPFTQREIEVLRYFAQGFTVNRTAEKMILSNHTIVAHRRKMFAKAKCHNLVDLISFAKKFDLL